MIIKELHTVNEEQQKEIRILEAICHKHDALTRNVFLDPSMNFDQTMKTAFLLYEDGQLVSFLSIFSPLAHEAEISAYTHPDYRTHGYFTTLLERASAELKRYHVSDLLLVTEAQSPSGKSVAETLDAYHDFTEYVLHYTHANDELVRAFPYKLQLISPTSADIDTLTEVFQAAFKDSYDNARSLITRTIESEGKTQYAVKYEGEIIGLVSTNLEDGEVSIYGLGIIPAMQGKGFGKEMLFLILKGLLDANHTQITLEVNSQNARAYQLYTKHGFAVQTAVDYYRKKLA